ncbi:sulfate ABC transporter substrate-binding protein [Candidatus Nitrotoga arctica]|uniref:Sulfate/thiosulfate ABC transporter periplasmic binding protein Sbp n=1 Tax=Candidatus Nitrotoga arctica TaxID=453162 RepID=A0ABN8AKE1_9PROT|nr:sulfate ABC transporter substrate-binding protein [Candidatus Nitrotoga arctica]CAG9933223.1 sulfate/thiosulfate ABC transporter periplasmic binding protein Sbp [Candidatus Nitrotoga arctica]
MMKYLLPVSLLLAMLVTVVQPSFAAKVTLLNASYDVSREFYKNYNPLFIKFWKQKTADDLTINQSHGGSSKQARSVLDGMEADVVTMNQSIDVDILADKHLVPANWAERLPYGSSPFSSTSVFLVRKGNPKGIKNWTDLAKTGVSVIIANPKTSGNGRYAYLAAWGSIIKQGGNETQARDLIAKIFANVPILESGGRGATTAFVQRNIGDVLVTFENEVQLIKQEYGADKFDIAYPPVSIVADLPVSVVDKVVDKRGTRKVAEAYLQHLYSPEAQDIAAQHELRPRDPAILAKYSSTLPPLKLFTVNEVFGSLKQAQAVHFKDGGLFDQIYSRK